MPSQDSLPTIATLLKGFGDAVRGAKDRFADVRRGSAFDLIAGPAAIIHTRQAQRDRDLFQTVYLDNADGTALTALIQGRYNVTRILDTYGVGTAYFVRPTASAGAGTIWNGTILRVTGLAGGAKKYKVTSDTAVAAGALAVTSVPIVALDVGVGSAIAATSGLVIDDVLFDATLTVQSLACGDGTSFESAEDYRARARSARIAARPGYLTALTNSVKAVGAVYSVFFPSYYGTDMSSVVGDSGINAAYVGDAGYSASTALTSACAVALESARVLGANMFVGSLATSSISVVASATLVDSPNLFDIISIKQRIVNAIVAYFGGVSGGFTYKLDGMQGAVLQACPEVQSVTFTTPSADVTISGAFWPAVLTRYILAPAAITLTISGPS